MNLAGSLILSLLLCTSASAQVSYSQFREIVEAFHQVYDSELRKQNAILVINSNSTEESQDIWWGFQDRHASYSSYVDPQGLRTHYAFIFGGYARIPQMTVDTVAMTLCHELGHGIGGPPYKDNPDEPPISVEGQSDYFAARHCIKRILSALKPQTTPQPLNLWVQQQCSLHFMDLKQQQLCWRTFQILEVERIYFKTQPGIEQETHYQTPDTSVVESIELNPYYYPSAQCRLDTMIAGILEKSPPRCWWKPN